MGNMKKFENIVVSDSSGRLCSGGGCNAMWGWTESIGEREGEESNMRRSEMHRNIPTLGIASQIETARKVRQQDDKADASCHELCLEGVINHPNIYFNEIKKFLPRLQ
jgi:hypothetical protein